MFNLEGKLIFTSEFTKANMDANHLLSDVYFININDSNKTLSTLKF
ncbi:hypothetical protein [Winogradskyella costae]